jgi:hypothetical protein
MERKEVVVVLDAGNDGTPIIDPDTFCCSLIFTWYKHY